MDVFKDVSWNSVQELIDTIINHSHIYLEDGEDREVRRSWLVKDGPKFLTFINEDRKTANASYCFSRYIQAWLLRGPEIRIHRSFDKDGRFIGNFICLKGNQLDSQGYIRIKKEFAASDAVYNKILAMIYENPIVRPFKGSTMIPIELQQIGYKSLNERVVQYEIRCADNGNRTWLDVAFDSESDAEAFKIREEFLPFIDKEITALPGDSMKAYWYHTRLHPYEGV